MCVSLNTGNVYTPNNQSVGNSQTINPPNNVQTNTTTSPPANTPTNTPPQQNQGSVANGTPPSSTEIRNDTQVLVERRTTVNNGRLNNVANSGLLDGVGSGAMGTNIRQDYSDTLRTTGNTPLYDGTNRESRMNSLRGVSQMDNDASTTYDNVRCGASCVVAGAYYAEGRQGLNNLIADMRAYNTQHGTGQNIDAYIGDLQTRLNNGGTITNSDMNNLQECLFALMNGSGDPSDGLDEAAIRGFIQESPNVRRMFNDNDLAIALVDTDGRNGGNHFVLGFQNNGRSTVYDPAPINNGGRQDQITQDPATIARYQSAIDNYGSTNQQYTYDGGPGPH